MTASSKEDVARALHPSSRRQPLDGALLADIAAGLAETVPLVAAPPLGVERIRLLSTDRYDVWMHAWAPGAVAEDHDHDGSISVIHVVVGSLTESVYAAPATAPDITVLDEGSTTGLDVLPTHSLANHGDGPAVSIHVYSPPLTRMPTD